MDHFAGLDVSAKETSICIVDDAGKIVREVKVASEPEALLAALKNPAYHFERIGLEAGLAIRVVAPTMCARACRAVLSGVHILLTETGLAGWGGRIRTSASESKCLKYSRHTGVEVVEVGHEDLGPDDMIERAAGGLACEDPVVDLEAFVVVGQRSWCAGFDDLDLQGFLRWS